MKQLGQARTTEVTFHGPQFDESDPGYPGNRLKKGSLKSLCPKQRDNSFRLSCPSVIAKPSESFLELLEFPDAKTVFMKLRELRNKW